MLPSVVSMKPNGKSAVVTGGTTGLGLAVAKALVNDGCQVMYAARKPAGSPLPGAHFHPLDVRDPDSVHTLMAAAADRFGGIDILVANAGTSRPGPVRALSHDDWTTVIDTNLTGTFSCVSAALPHLEKSPQGRIITLSSALAVRPAPGASSYAASKAALEMFTRVLALEVAAQGITANCVSPGFIDAGMGRRLSANTAVWPAYEAKLATPRLGTGDEVAAAVRYLISPDASYVNGHVLEVNGGLRW